METNFITLWESLGKSFITWKLLVGGDNPNGPIFLSQLNKVSPELDAPIFCETVASFRMEKFENKKKRPMFFERMSDV